MKKAPKALVISSLFAALAGCSVIDSRHRVEGWPELEVIEHHVDHAAMRDKCGAFTGPFSSPEGCAIFYFQDKTCAIYVSKDFPNRSALEHERQHCKGFDHVGSGDMAAMLRDWIAREAEPTRYARSQERRP